MNIVLINHYAGAPALGMAFRPYYLAREWVEQGHKVTIIASSYSHLRSLQPSVSRKIAIENIDNINYIWVKTRPYNGNGVGRILNILQFVSKVFLRRNKISKQLHPDLVIASSTYPLDIYPCKAIAKRAKAKLVFEVHDLWPLSPMELGGYSKYHPFIIIMQKAENDACKYCDKVVSLLPNTKEHLVSHGLSPDKFVYIPNGIDVQEWEHLEQEHIVFDKLKKIKSSGNLLVGYVGSHGLANALDAFIDAAALLTNEKISFVLVGKGPEKDSLQKKVKDLHLNNVEFLSPVPKYVVPSLLSFFDVLYIGLQNASLFRFGISPNKLFDYMMSGKIIINAIKAANDPVAESGCGVSVEPENPQSIASALQKIIQMDEKQRIEMGKQGRVFVMKNHNYKVLAKQFLNHI